MNHRVSQLSGMDRTHSVANPNVPAIYWNSQSGEVDGDSFHNSQKPHAPRGGNFISRFFNSVTDQVKQVFADAWALPGLMWKNAWWNHGKHDDAHGGNNVATSIYNDVLSRDPMNESVPALQGANEFMAEDGLLSANLASEYTGYVGKTSTMYPSKMRQGHH